MAINSSGENLIFLISQPRSGSTLLQLILGSNPDVATTSEPWVALHPLYALRDDGVEAEYDASWAREALKDFLNQSKTGEGFYKRQIASMLVSLYTQAIESSGGAKYFLDKTPRYYEIMEDLVEMFPASKFIILMRNPLAVLNSILKTWVKDNWALLSRFRRDLVVAPRKLTDFSRKHPEHCITVRYEDLVNNPEEKVGLICRFLGIPFQEDMLNYKKDSSWKYGDQNVYKAKSPSKASIDGWKVGLSSSEASYYAASYLRELGPELIMEMGYDYAELKSVYGEKAAKSRAIPWSAIIKDKADPFEKMEFYSYEILLTKGKLLPRWAKLFILKASFTSLNFIRRFYKSIYAGK